MVVAVSWRYYLYDMRVRVFTSFFAVLAFFAMPSFVSAAGEFSGLRYPRTIGVDGKNSLLYVTESFQQDGNVYVFDIAGSGSGGTKSDFPLVVTIKTNRLTPFTVAVDNVTGYTYISYSREKEIWIFDGKAVREGTNKPLERITFSEEEQQSIAYVKAIPAHDGKRVFFVLYGPSQRIIVAHPSGRPLRTIPLDRHPFSIAYITDRDALAVSYGVGFDTVTMIPIRGGDRKEILTPYPVGKIVYNEDRHLIFGTDALGSHLMVIRPDTDQVTELGLPFQAHFLDSDKAGNIYFANYFTKALGVVDVKGKLTKVPMSVHPITMSVIGEHIALLGHNGFLEIIDTRQMGAPHRVADTGRRGPTFGPQQLFYALGGDSVQGRVFVANEDMDTVVVVSFADGATKTVHAADNNTATVLRHPSGSTFLDGKLFVSNFAGFVSVFDQKTEAHLKTIPLESSVDAIIVFDKRIYAVSSGAGKMYEIDPSTYTISAGIELAGFHQDVERAGSVLLAQVLGDPHLLAVTDEISGRWVFVDPIAKKSVRWGVAPLPGLVRTPFVVKDAVLEVSSMESSIQRTVWDADSKAHVTKVPLPKDHYPLFASVKVETGELMVFVRDSAGIGKVLIIAPDDEVRESFPVGKNADLRLNRVLGGFNHTETAMAVHNLLTDSIWSVGVEHINIFDKKGVLKNTILFSDPRSYMLADKEMLFIFGINKINAISLQEEKIVKTWDLFTATSHNGVSNLSMVKKPNAQEGQGISLVPTYDLITYYNYADDAWHTITNRDGAGAPKFVPRPKATSPEGVFTFNKKTAGFILLIVVLLMLIFKISRSGKDQNLSVINSL